jgi:DNA-binding transcriptional ArsR family regulator
MGGNMFVYTFGKIIDLLTAYRLFFDPNNMRVALPDVVDMTGISNTLRPFFTCNKTGNTFIEMLLLSQPSKDIAKTTIHRLIGMIDNHQKFMQELLIFYFPNENVEYKLNNDEVFRIIADMVMASNLSHELKCQILTIALAPEHIIKQLTSHMLFVYAQIESLYENEFGDTSDRYEEETKKLLSNLPYKGSNVYPVLSLVDSECCKRWGKDGAEFLVVGRKYKPGEGNSKRLCLSSLGGILAEPARIQILDLILEKKKVTCFDVNVGVGFKGNTGYYHLTAMLKSGMLNTESKGKTKYYSLNPSYFEYARELIGEYCKK